MGKVCLGIRKKLFIGTVPTNKKLSVGTVPSNNLIRRDPYLTIYISYLNNQCRETKRHYALHIFFCKQLLFLVEARVACVLGKYEAESCYGVA